MAMRAGPSAGSRPHAPMASRLTYAEGALALIAVYALAGSGIGAVAGSVLTGVIVGCTVGVCAAAAVLLVSGAAVSGAAEARARSAIRPAPRDSRPLQLALVRPRVAARVPTQVDR